MFQNEVEIIDATPVFTNPQSKVVISGSLVQQGKKYYTFKTIWNYIKYGFFTIFSFLVRRAVRDNPSYQYRRLPARPGAKSSISRDSNVKSLRQ